MFLVSRCFESSCWPCFCYFLLLWRFPYRGRPVPPEGPGLWGQGHMSKEMTYVFVAGILVDMSLCFWCLGASNLHVDLVFVIFSYCSVSPIGAGHRPL